MSRSRIAILIAVFAFPETVPAQQIGVLAEYLQPILEEIVADPNTGGWIWETNGNGGYLLRQAMDVTGDGVPEQFITTSLTAVMNEAEWIVFDINQRGEMNPYDSSIRFPSDSVSPATGSDPASLVHVAAPDQKRLQSNDRNHYPVYRYSFAFPKIEKTLSYLSEDSVGELVAYRAVRKPKLEGILLSDYLAKPDSKWSKVDEWKLDSNDCFFIASDRERAEKNKAFTPEVALSLLGVSNSSSQPRVEHLIAQHPKGTNGQPFVFEESLNATHSQSVRNDRKFLLRWSIICAMIAVVGGLIWIRRTRRS